MLRFIGEKNAFSPYIFLTWISHLILYALISNLKEVFYMM